MHQEREAASTPHEGKGSPVLTLQLDAEHPSSPRDWEQLVRDLLPSFSPSKQSSR